MRRVNFLHVTRNSMSAELVLQEAKTRLDLLLADVNTLLAPFQPWQIALGSVLLTFTLSYLYDLLFQEEPILTRMKHGVFAFARKIPYVRNKIKSEIAGVQQGLQKSLLKLSPNKPSLSRLPSQGSSADAIIEQLRGLMSIAPFNKRVEEFRVCLCPSAPHHHFCHRCRVPCTRGAPSGTSTPSSSPRCMACTSGATPFTPACFPTFASLRFVCPRRHRQRDHGHY